MEHYFNTKNKHVISLVLFNGGVGGITMLAMLGTVVQSHVGDRVQVAANKVSVGVDVMRQVDITVNKLVEFFRLTRTSLQKLSWTHL